MSPCASRDGGATGPAPAPLRSFQGRAEFIEKYLEVAAQLLERNLDVVLLDWRGQGGSERLTLHPGKGHVRDFSLYQRDLEALRHEVLEPYGRAPFFALGHSMAGAILLDQGGAGVSIFERTVLTAPMIDLPEARSQGSRTVLSQFLSRSALDAPSRRATADQRPIWRAPL